jgi:hypothetical protein
VAVSGGRVARRGHMVLLDTAASVNRACCVRRAFVATGVRRRLTGCSENVHVDGRRLERAARASLPAPVKIDGRALSLAWRRLGTLPRAHVRVRRARIWVRTHVERGRRSAA